MFFVYALLIFPLLIGLNILAYRIIVKKAIKKYIEPKLKEKGLLFVDFKWPGLMSSGDFEGDFLISAIMNKMGWVSNSIYVYIYYRDLDDTKKVTVRIDTTFFIINKVAYSSEFY